MDFRPVFTLTPLLLRQIKAVERVAGFLEAVELHKAWSDELRQHVRVEDALSSLQIEGSSLTLEEAFGLARDREREVDRDSEREFLNYLLAFEAIDGYRGERGARVGAAEILNLHRVLVRGVRGGDRFAGRFRVEPVQVGDRVGGEVVVHHAPPPWTEVEGEVDALVRWIAAVKEIPSRRHVERGGGDPWVHPVIVAGIAQHRLVWIHPFIDGNGRTARMLTAMLLYQRGYDFKYLFDLSTYYNKDRDKYYEALRTVDRSGDYTRWLEYFLGGFSYQLVKIKQGAIKAAAGLAIGGDDDAEAMD